MTLAADDYPLVDVMWTLALLFALMTYFWLVITVFGDLFRRDMSGWAKVAWTVCLLVLPIVGAVTYLITQGSAMVVREEHRFTSTRRPVDDHLRSGASSGSRGIDEVARAKQLLDDGALTQAEYDELKRRVLA